MHVETMAKEPGKGKCKGKAKISKKSNTMGETSRTKREKVHWNKETGDNGESSSNLQSAIAIQIKPDLFEALSYIYAGLLTEL